MDLIICPKCKKVIDNAEESCTYCGYSLKELKDLNLEVDNYRFNSIDDVCEDLKVTVYREYGGGSPYYNRIYILKDNNDNLYHKIAIKRGYVSLIDGSDIIDAGYNVGEQTEQDYSIIGGIVGGLASGGSQLGQLYGGLTMGEKEFATVDLMIRRKYKTIETTDRIPMFIKENANSMIYKRFAENSGSLINDILSVMNKNHTLNIMELNEILIRIKEREKRQTQKTNEANKIAENQYEIYLNLSKIVKWYYFVIAIALMIFSNNKIKVGYDGFITLWLFCLLYIIASFFISMQLSKYDEKRKKEKSK